MSRTFGASQNKYINKRNFKNQMIAFLGNKLGVGPALGNIYFVATSGGYWEDNLLYCGVANGEIFTSLAEAEDECTASQHDVVCITPGYYDETSEIAWDKAQTHIVGLSSPNVYGDYSESNICVYTDSTDNGSVVTVTGANCQFHNTLFQNAGNNAACLTAFTLDAYGCYFKGCGFSGVMTAGNNDVVAAASLYIDDGGSYPIFEDCVIGQNAWDVRKGANSGVLRFVGTGAGGPYNGLFKNCRFLSRSETATVAMVALPANFCMHGTWLFDKCSFENYYTNWAANLNQVFYDNCGSTHGILLRDCSAIGFDEWQDADAGNNWIGATMPIVGTGGGLVRNPTGTTGN